MSSLAANPTSFHIQRDGNNQEYVETCDGWVRATLVTFDKALMNLSRKHQCPAIILARTDECVD